MEKIYSNLNKTVSILMPAFNEGQNIEKVIRSCIDMLDNLKINGEVVVTNDGSLDNTRAILNTLKEKISNLVIINHEKNMGYGASLYDAIFASKGDIVVTIDSDGQFDIKELPLFLDLYVSGRKIITGYRKEKKDSFMRILANKFQNFLVNLIFGLKLKDANCAFKLYESDFIKSLKIESKGFQTPTEIMIKAKVLGYDIAEVGITHAFRERGRSALGLIKTTIDMLTLIIYLRLKIFRYRRD